MLLFMWPNKSYIKFRSKLQFSSTCSPVSMFKAKCRGYQTDGTQRVTVIIFALYLLCIRHIRSILHAQPTARCGSETAEQARSNPDTARMFSPVTVSPSVLMCKYKQEMCHFHCLKAHRSNWGRILRSSQKKQNSLNFDRKTLGSDSKWQLTT